MGSGGVGFGRVAGPARSGLDRSSSIGKLWDVFGAECGIRSIDGKGEGRDEETVKSFYHFVDAGGYGRRRSQ